MRENLDYLWLLRKPKPEALPEWEGMKVLGGDTGGVSFEHLAGAPYEEFIYILDYLIRLCLAIDNDILAIPLPGGTWFNVHPLVDRVKFSEEGKRRIGRAHALAIAGHKMHNAVDFTMEKHRSCGTMPESAPDLCTRDCFLVPEVAQFVGRGDVEQESKIGLLKTLCSLVEAHGIFAFCGEVVWNLPEEIDPHAARELISLIGQRLAYAAVKYSAWIPILDDRTVQGIKKLQRQVRISYVEAMAELITREATQLAAGKRKVVIDPECAVGLTVLDALLSVREELYQKGQGVDRAAVEKLKRLLWDDRTRPEPFGVQYDQLSSFVDSQDTGWPSSVLQTEAFLRAELLEALGRGRLLKVVGPSLLLLVEGHNFVIVRLPAGGFADPFLGSSKARGMIANAFRREPVITWLLLCSSLEGATVKRFWTDSVYGVACGELEALVSNEDVRKKAEVVSGLFVYLAERVPGAAVSYGVTEALIPSVPAAIVGPSSYVLGKTVEYFMRRWFDARRMKVTEVEKSVGEVGQGTAQGVALLPKAQESGHVAGETKSD